MAPVVRATAIILALLAALAIVAPASAPIATTLRQNVHYGPAAAQVMDVYSPMGLTPALAVVFVHSATGGKAEWGPAAKLVADAGYVGITIDYRIHAPWPGTLDDVAAAVQYVHSRAGRLRVDPRRIALGGASLGGLLALDVADRRKRGFVRAAFGWSGGYDVVSLATESTGWQSVITGYLTGCSVLACPGRYAYASADHYLDRNDPPTRIANSTNELTPLSQLTAMDAALRAAHVYDEVAVVPGGAHGIALWPTEWPLTLAFLQRELGAP